jgi:hypothetical protein
MLTTIFCSYIFAGMSYKHLSSGPVSVVKLNNEAALQIQRGEYAQAVSTLSTALVSMKESIKNGQCYQDRSETAAADAGSALEFLSPSEDEYCSISLLSSRKINNIKCDHWFLYEDPVSVKAERALSSQKCVEILSYSIVYNLGLCHHLKALYEDASTINTALLQRAVTFYNHAQKLMLAHDMDMDMDMLHTLAIANNLGHAYHFLHNEPTAKVCFQRLLNAIMCISESGQEGRRILTSRELCFDGFLTNVMYFIGSSSAAPAA